MVYSPLMQTESLFLSGSQCHTSVLFGVGTSTTVNTIAGWNTPARELVAEFTQDQRRAPTSNEITILRALAQRANDILKRGNIVGGKPSRADEMDWNTAHGLINFYLIKARGPDNGPPAAPPRGGPETEALVKNAVNAVPKKQTFFDDVEAVASGAANIVVDVANIVGEAAKAPLYIAQAIASGERLDHVFINAAKAQMKIIKDAAPYAQAVIAFVPGIGTTAAAAIAGGIALAEGKSIDEAAKAAIRAAIPGGAVALAAYDTATKVLSGQNVTKAMIEAARNAIPEGPARQAYDIGTAVATGEKIQTAIAHGLANMASDQIQKVLAEGAKMVTDNPTLKNALATLKASPEVEQGFKIASGLVNQKNISEKALQAVRSGLTAELQKGFDAAVKVQEPTKPWLANVVGKPSPIKAVPLKVPPPKPAPPAAASPIKAAPPKAAPAASQVVAKTPPGQDRRYGPYPKQAGVVAGVGAGGPAYRWFAVYADGRLTAQQGPRWLSDDAALAERAAYLDATQGRGYFGAVHQWNWDGSNWLQVA